MYIVVSVALSFITGIVFTLWCIEKGIIKHIDDGKHTIKLKL